VAFFAHYINLLHICTLAPLPSHAQLRSSPLHTYTCRSAAVEKLEVAERRSGALRLTLTTALDDKKEDYENRSVLHWVLQLCAVASSLIPAVNPTSELLCPANLRFYRVCVFFVNRGQYVLV